MVVRQPDFTCCTRGTTEAGKPARNTDFSSLTVPVNPELNAAPSVKMILTDYLTQVSKVDNNVKEQVIDYTFNDDIGLLALFSATWSGGSSITTKAFQTMSGTSKNEHFAD